MKKFFVILIMIVFSQNASGEECPTKNARGENCISATPSVETDGDWVTYKESLTNSCDCACNADFQAIGDVGHGDIVAPHGKGEVICLNVRGKGCRGFEKSFRFTCQREGNDSSSSPPRQGNPYLKSESTKSDQDRKFSKDECRDERCANASYETTEDNPQLTDAAKAICDRQYLQCLNDGQAKPDFDQALRIARTQVPAEAPTPEPQPAPSTPAYVSQTYGPLADCFWDPIFLSKGGVAMCLGPSSMRAELPGCYTPDIVNGRQAYICQGANQGPEMFFSRKSEYGGGRSW